MTGRSNDGLFVTIDGMAGAGKTTTTRLLGPFLRDLGYRVHITAEVTDDAIGTLARLHTDRYRGHALACLVAADRYHHLDTEIRPHLRDGDIVLCDRYVASSYVLQQMDGVPLPFIESLNSHADPADLTVMLLAEPVVAAARIATRGAHDRFQAGIDFSRVEAEMYCEAAAKLIGAGATVLTIDTSEIEPCDVIQQLAERIADHPEVPSERSSARKLPPHAGPPPH